jgi:hypothetical protein
MGLKCSICQHSRRKEIEKDLVAQKPNFSAIALKYKVDRGALRRHKDKGHISEKIARAAAVKDVAEAKTLRQQVEEVCEEIKTVLTRAKTAKNDELALKALKELRGTIELLLKAQGELPDGNVTVQILVQESNQLTDIFMEALRSEIDPETCRRVISYIERRRTAITATPANPATS